jgi:hypothetical protein
MRWIMKKPKNEEKHGVRDEKLRSEYNRSKERYLSLCRRYELNPFDLGIVTIGSSHLPKGDKVQLVKYVMRLIRLERALGSKLRNGMFSLTIEESRRSGYLIPLPKNGG